MPDLKILVVSRHDEELYAERALRAGAKGYLMKLEATETLLTALRQILDGGIYLSQSVSNKILLKVASGNKPETDNPLDHLSDRERSEEHTSELQSRGHLVCRLLLEK